MPNIVPKVPTPLVPGSKMTMRDFFRCESRLRAQRSRLPDPEAAQICGRSLRQIRDEEGWRMYRHASFEEYLAKDWFGWTLAEAQALIAAVEDEEVSRPTTEPAQRHLVEAIGDLFDEAGPPETPEEVNAELIAAGHDPDEVGARMKAAAEKALAEAAPDPPAVENSRIVATTALIVDPEIQLQARGLDEDTVADYVVAMQNGVKFPPLVAFEDAEGALWLADGFHRLAALRWSSYDRAKVEIHSGDKRAASLHAATANARHGRPMSRAEKQEAGERLLRLTNWSQEEIARRLAVDRGTVSKWKSSLEISRDTTRTVTRDGTTYEMDVSNIGQEQALQARQSAMEKAARERRGAAQRQAAAPPDTWQPPHGWRPLLEGPDAEQVYRVTADLYGDVPSEEKLQAVALLKKAMGDVDDATLAQAARAQNGKGRLAVHFSSEGDEWLTPPHVVELVIQALGGIDLDPCSNNHGEPHIPAKQHFTVEDDGLSREWSGKVYMNPPYGRSIEQWVEKLIAENAAGRVPKAIALLPARTDTAWFHKLRDFPRCFIHGRLRFSDHDSGAPFPSMLVGVGFLDLEFAHIFSTIGDTYVRVQR